MSNYQIIPYEQSLPGKINEFDEVDPGVDIGSNKRLPCILVTDTSYSMRGAPIGEVNAGLVLLREVLLKDEIAAESVEASVIRFGGEVQVAHDFALADRFTPPQLQARGGTPMGKAIERAVSMDKERKRYYRAQGLEAYRTWIWLLTDGCPTDSIVRAEQLLRQGEQAGDFLFFAVGTESADFNTLKRLSGERPPVKLNGLDFKGMFEFISASLSQVSRSQPGDQLALPAPQGWGQIVT